MLLQLTKLAHALALLESQIRIGRLQVVDLGSIKGFGQYDRYLRTAIEKATRTGRAHYYVQLDSKMYDKDLHVLRHVWALPDDQVIVVERREGMTEISILLTDHHGRSIDHSRHRKMEDALSQVRHRWGVEVPHGHPVL